MKIVCTALLSALAATLSAGEPTYFGEPIPAPPVSPVAPAPVTPTPAALAAAGVRVTLKTDATSTDEQVYVGDVAVITGVPEAVSAEMYKYPVCRSANPGQVRTVSGSDVLAALQKFAKSKSKPELKGDDVKVMASAQVVSGAALSEAAAAAVRTELSKDADFDVRCESVGNTNDQIIRAGEYELNADLPEEGPRPGTQSVRVRILQNGKRIAETVCTINAHVICTLRVAAEHIPSGDVLEATEVKSIRREVTANELHERCDTAKLYGMRARSTISAGQMLTRVEFALPYVIKRGDAVHLVVRRGSLELVATGQARNDAAIDDPVKIFVIDSNAEVMARASGVREASMDDPGSKQR